jgi:hypothetical protein
VRRHEIDYVSLVAGGLLLAVAGVHFTAGSADNELDVRWTVPLLLLLLGVVGLMGALRGTRPEPVADPGTVQPAPADAADATAGTDVEAEPEADTEAGDEADTAVPNRDEGTTRS